MYRLRTFWYDLYCGFQSLFRWLPVIWKDRHYDHHYLFTVLEKKLSLMEQTFEEDTMLISKDHQKRTQQIKTARILAGRIANREYLENALFWHEKVHPYLGFDFEQIEIEGKPFYRLIDLNSLESQKSFLQCGDHARYMEKQDQELFFKFVKKHISKWWC